jgi:RHH-type proline utilization regulon transcriptional repressor/proline dehydrogenase/delta 1-pyrroline-5-carboxylate dehydrogenase
MTAADPLAPIRRAHAADEAEVAQRLAALAHLPDDATARVAATATRLVEGVRAHRPRLGDLDTLLSEYRLSSREGVVLMCLAEALLRIPDTTTADRLIRDKIGSADWEKHLGHSPSAFVNASTWALMLTGRLLQVPPEGPVAAARRLVAKAGEPVVREALVQAMRVLGRQFVMGRTITEALGRAAGFERRGFRHSFDMLGEAARTAEDAERHFRAYADAIAAIGAAAAGRGPVEGPGISVKLTALHPRVELGQIDRVRAELVPKLAELCRSAASVNIGLTVDAEEAERLEPTLAAVTAMIDDPTLAGWEGFGLAVQAYQKRALALVDWLVGAATARRRRLMLRLVKGAYWDTEIKRAQERGLAGYPVFTRKAATDASWLACARRLLTAGPAVFPQFATHNAHSCAAVLEMAGERRDWEFQRLHGMGEALYAQLVPDHPCRTYAPVGSHEDLLPYLVRRLLENGANTSFVNRIADAAVPVERIVADPVATLATKAQPRIPLPRDLYLPERINARGVDLACTAAVAELQAGMAAALARDWSAAPIIAGGEILAGPTNPVRDPADRRRLVGTVIEATPGEVDRAVNLAVDTQKAWDCAGPEARAAVLERAADRYEAALPALVALVVREAGKTLADAVAEVREAVDLLRYYATQARATLGPRPLPGVAGEANALSLHGRGVFACISPWNFPLAIFTGQVAAALAVGNAVVAKPAPQTPLVAAEAVRLLHRAGVPPAVLALLPGGPAVGAMVVAHPRLAGVAFTGSTATARAINRSLSGRDGPIVPLIAETGGVNAMVVDSSALPEQVVADVVDSAFRSAGQRCSALRLLLVQRQAWDRITRMLAGAARELSIGDPALLSTDVGPVIDTSARDLLTAHRLGTPLFECALPPGIEHGTFAAPRAFVLDHPGDLRTEVFGPILHLCAFDADRLDDALDAVAASGYGLTLGIHSRIDATVEHIRRLVPVGNTYVNRSMIGAAVGAQPFGGEGLSGTGPKAGGPGTLARFATERCTTVNLSAAGGDPGLLSLGGD